MVEPSQEQTTVGYGLQKGSERAENFSIDDFVHTRTRILNTKLEVLASAMLVDLDRRSNYLARQHKEKAPFYGQLFKLEQERRLQDVECWRDVVLVLRDFLDAWEAHEQAKAKAVFLDHV